MDEPQRAEAKGALSLRGVSKFYGDFRAVNDVSLEIRPGEFVTLLGPSGSGKTTTLRIVAGFIPPDGGEVVLDGDDLTRVPPYKRDVGMVFQNYALFPHMTAAENISFPLEMRRVPKEQRRRMVQDALGLVRLEGFGERYPRQLSGGQQQRVALVRALVFHPSVLLMDEPLGALDKKLREALQLEVLRVSHELNLTVVYVTHDQEEALVMSDRIAVYNHGRIVQLGTGQELYERPASLFVADFIGESNVFRGRLRAAEGVLVRVGGHPIRVPEDQARRLGDGGRAAVVVRPERMWVRSGRESDGRSDEVVLPGRLLEVIYLGSTVRFVVEVEGGITVLVRTQDPRAAGAMDDRDVVVGWRVEEGVLVPDTGEATATEAEFQQGRVGPGATEGTGGPREGDGAGG